MNKAPSFVRASTVDGDCWLNVHQIIALDTTSVTDAEGFTNVEVMTAASDLVFFVEARVLASILGVGFESRKDDETSFIG